MSNLVRSVIINFQTPDLLRIAVESFRTSYPRTPLLIVDNGSKDDSRETIAKLQTLAPQQTDVLFLDSNIYHGPAMHRVMNEVKEEFVFFLDSDTDTRRGGFLEAMQSELDTSQTTYGIGRSLTVNKRGFQVSVGMSVLAPAYMMIRRDMYFALPPFEHHGLPVLKNFLAAQQKGYTLHIFPIEQYIDHRWRGTASRFGYGLGWRGKLDFVLNKVGL
jgi:glycosyltransferase involved in cell wall biosynthesis